MPLKNGKFLKKIKFEMKNISPLNIGRGEGEPLLDEEENKAYIPGTTLAGAIRAYLELSNSKDFIEKLFGNKTDNDSISKLYVYDSHADLLGTEIRPGVKIDRFSGAAKDGGKFERKYIPEGHKFHVNVEIYGENYEEIESFSDAVYFSIDAINRGNITLGSYKSGGAGFFKVNHIEEAAYDFNDAKQLFNYLKNADNYVKKDINAYNSNSNYNRCFIHYELKGELKTPLLIKGISTLDYNRADDEQYQSSNGEYIIPGTSIKGVVRSQGEKILKYFNKENLIGDIFGTSENEIKASKFIALDSVINNVKKTTYSKVKVDRFTGGVSNGQKKDEEPVMGEVSIKGMLKIKDQKNYKEAIALIALIFRDIAIGDLSLGSGSNVGRGRVKGRELRVFRGDEVLFSGNFESDHIEKDNMGEYINALRKRG